MISSGGIAYKVITAEATLLSDKTKVSVVTLMARHAVARAYERLPSVRYMVSVKLYQSFRNE